LPGASVPVVATNTPNCSVTTQGSLALGGSEFGKHCPLQPWKLELHTTPHPPSTHVALPFAVGLGHTLLHPPQLFRSSSLTH
jgi:hypothetical protein